MSETIILDINSPPVQHLYKKDKRLAKVISMVGPITYTTYADDPYAFLIHEIIEQMLSIKSGATIYNKFINLCNGRITPKVVNNLSFEEIKSIGTATSKVKFIKGLTEKIISGNLDLESLQGLSDSDVQKSLMSIYGIGQWTSKMYLIFVLDRPDILPLDDVAFLQAYEWLYKTNNRNKDSIIKRCKKWKPYSSYAARFLYKALNSGLTKTEFHLYK